MENRIQQKHVDGRVIREKANCSGQLANASNDEVKLQAETTLAMREDA
jgi:hypothetical protein